MMVGFARWSVRDSLRTALLEAAAAGLVALLSTGCGDDAADGGEGGGDGAGGAGNGSPSSGPGGGVDPLTPGAAGSGVLAYTVTRDGESVVEVTDLDAATVVYASDGTRTGAPERLYLTHSGGHLVWAGGADADLVNVCWHVDLATGAESDCRITSDAYMLTYPIGVAEGGARIAHTGLRLSDGQKLILIDDGAGVTEIATEPDFMPFNGGISPDGATVFALHYEATAPTYALWSYPIGGTPALVAELPEGITASLDRTVIDVSEGGDRLLFACFDAAEQGLLGQSQCAVDVATGTLTVLTGLSVGTMTPSGDRIVGARIDVGGFDVFDFGSDVPARQIALDGASPALSPDGDRVAYRVIDSAPGQWYAPYTATLDGQGPVQVAASDDSAPSTGVLRWSR